MLPLHMRDTTFFMVEGTVVVVVVDFTVIIMIAFR